MKITNTTRKLARTINRARGWTLTRSQLHALAHLPSVPVAKREEYLASVL